MTEFRVMLTVPPKGLKQVSPEAPLPPLPAPKSAIIARPTAPVTEAVSAEQARQAEAEREFIQATLGHLAAELQSFQENRREATKRIEQAAVEMAVVVASRLLFRDLEEDRLAIEEMVRDMVAGLIDDQPAVVRLNPKDFHLMQRRLGSRLLFPDEEGSPKVMPDNSVPRGGCLVEGTAGSGLHHDPVEELSKVREELLERMAHAHP